MTNQSSEPFSLPPLERTASVVPAGAESGAADRSTADNSPRARRPVREWMTLGAAVVVSFALGVAVAATTHTGGHHSKQAARVAVTTTSTLPSSRLLARLVPGPSGFAPSNINLNDGPMSAKAFDVYVSSPNEDTDLHFMGGYQKTYMSTTNDDEIDVAVFEFKSSDGAARFKDDYESAYSYTTTPDANIVGADDYVQTPDSTNTSYDHGVVATKGARAFVIDYYDASQADVPLVGTLATQQEARL
jgi:hypothetical protein